MNRIYLVVGAPGSGKTWVCKQLEDKYEYLPHDDFTNDSHYVGSIIRLSRMTDKPILIETPFSISQIVNPLEKHGFTVTPVFILESPVVTASRYLNREGREIPKGHLTRIETYKQRAQEYRAFHGTSEAVLSHLRGLV